MSDSVSVARGSYGWRGVGLAFGALLVMGGLFAVVRGTRSETVDYGLTTLGMVPLFAAYAVWMLFVLAVLGRVRMETTPEHFDAALSWLTAQEESWSWLNEAPALPPWMANGWVIAALGIVTLAQLSIGRLEMPEDATAWVLSPFKGLAAAAVALTLDGDPTRWFAQAGASGVSEGDGWVVAWSVLIGGATFALAMLRGGLYALLEDAPEVSSAVKAIEAMMGTAGLFFLLLFPALAALCLGMALLLVTALSWWVNSIELRKREPCEQCGTPNFRAALTCAKCETRRTKVHALGLMGRSLDRLVHDPTRHLQKLRESRRCPRCAARFRSRGLAQVCSVCGAAPFASREEAEEFLRTLQRRLPASLLTCWVIGLVPFVGLFFGVLYYRLTLISCLRGYVSVGRNVLIRIGLRVFAVSVLAFQWTPVLGACGLPLVAYVNYVVYKRALRAQFQTAWPRAEAAVPAFA